MEIHHDGVEVYVLPDGAKCKADSEGRSPCDMDVCPLGYETCIQDCEEYTEEW